MHTHLFGELAYGFNVIFANHNAVTNEININERKTMAKLGSDQ